MKILSKVSLILFAVITLSCESKEKEVEKLKTETIAIHDEVMPKMDDIMKLKKSLKDAMLEADSVQKEEIRNRVGALEEADQAMMNWMRNYDPRMEDMTDAEKIEYLKNQKASISEVSEKMKKSIAEAKTYLNL
jgi:hypothetical protein